MKKDNLIITIGRENGSGGRYIGEKIASDLGIKCYNNELLEEAARECDIDFNELQKNDEKKPNRLLYFGGQSVPTNVFNKESNFIRRLATRESCVIIGRCSNVVLSDFSNVVNVFVHAPIEYRIERYCKRNNVNAIDALKRINKEDKERANYYNFYTSGIWGDSKSYNLSIDTSKTGIDGAVLLIKNYIEITSKNKDGI